MPRDLLACREATLACEGVFFACFLRPSLVRGFQQEAERILSAACTLSKAASVAPPTTAGTLTHQANLLLVSMLCLLSPPLDADGAPAEEAATKADVARFANAIAPALERCGPGADTGLAAVLVLALAAVGPATASSINMRGGLREACAAGALGYLR